MNQHHQSGLWGAIVRLLLYVCIVLSPLLLVAVLRPETDHGFIYTVGKNLALVGFTIIAMQFVLSARWKWIERPFGLDVLFHFHKAMGVIATFLVFFHPFLLAIGGNDWSVIFGSEVVWHIWLGRIALLVLLLHVLFAVFRFVLISHYETWRFIHNIGAVLVLLLGFFHGWNSGGDFADIWMKAFWLVLLLTASFSYLWHRVFRAPLLRRNPYTVTEVSEVAAGVWTIELQPPPGILRFDYLPGQFHFLTFQRAPHLPVEEHHWTISSSPTTPDVLRSTIKESGDFTASIGKTKPGDTALVDGPYGRFSYTLHADERELVFIAGGIGITPLMSMLRHIRDTGADRTVTLLYASTRESDIVFREELAAMERDGVAHLTVIHVVSEPTAEWKGEHGRLDEQMAMRLIGPERMHSAFYLCAPRELMRKMIAALRKAHVPATRIHFERFSL